MNVHHYNLRLDLDTEKKIIGGNVNITFSLKKSPRKLEFDLLNTYRVSNTLVNNKPMVFYQRGNKLYIEHGGLSNKNKHVVKITYLGKPPTAVNPPWEGGITWSKCADGYPWVAISCQKNGAHIWYPCKEHPSDKADSVDIYITVQKPLKVASNGTLQGVQDKSHYKHTWHWKTSYPISPYNINFTVGNFDVISKRSVVLNDPIYIEYFVLPESIKGAGGLLEKAEKYLTFYTEFFGPYPWKKEKLGLVETPYWGMEHQTIIAYGNKYQNTALGYDFLLFHEMGHEWWGNYLSVYDWKDFWIHEGFVTYSEALYIEKEFGLGAYHRFIKDRCKKNIKNYGPIVNEKPTKMDYYKDNDVYYKGAFVLHMLRYLLGDDLMKLSLKEFLIMPKSKANNQTSTKEFMLFLENNSGLELDFFFKQYVYGKEYPTLNIKEKIYHNGKKKFIELWWSESGFELPVEVRYQGNFAIETVSVIVTEKTSGISIPATSKPQIDPNNWLLFNTKIH